MDHNEMDQGGMGHDGPADSLAKSSNRVSIRAVLVPKGQDAAPALLKNGILNPVVVPFVIADVSSAGAPVLGDGRTPNLVGKLELGTDDPFDPPPAFSQFPSQRPEDPEQEDEPLPRKTTTLPEANGLKSFAPIWKRQR